MKIKDIIVESFNFEGSMKALAGILNDKFVDLFRELDLKAEKYSYNNGDMKYFMASLGMIKAKWTRSVYDNEIKPELYELRKWVRPEFRTRISRFLNEMNNDGGFWLIQSDLLAILSDIASIYRNPELTRAINRSFNCVKNLEEAVEKLQIEYDAQEDTYYDNMSHMTVPSTARKAAGPTKTSVSPVKGNAISKTIHQPDPTVKRSQFDAVDKIVNDTLTKLRTIKSVGDSGVADIRRQLGRSDNKLKTLQHELELRGIEL